MQTGVVKTGNGESCSISMTQNENKVLAIAREIYDAWQIGGILLLVDYLVETLGLEQSEAETLAKFYQPEHPPIALKLEDAIQNNLESSAVFEKIGFQLTGYWPKNVLAWHVIRSIYGEDSFDFMVTGTDSSHGNNQILFPALLCDEQGVVQKFGRAALGAVNKDGLPAHVVKKSLVFQERLSKEIGLSLTEKFLDAKVIFPPAPIVKLLCQAIKQAQTGQPLILTAIICPDYSYEKTGNPVVPYRYNFETLNTGVGLVAQQVARVIPYLVGFCKENGLEYKVKIFMADFEADDQAVLDKVKLSKADFVQRCQASLQAFGQALPLIPMELELFKASCGEDLWLESKILALRAMRQGNFGKIRESTGKDPAKQAVFIAKANHGFYCDWYGADFSEEQSVQLVIEQGAEYAAANRILQERFLDTPIIQIAGDRPKMQMFNYWWAQIPTICTKRVY